MDTTKELQYAEKIIKGGNGMLMLILSILIILAVIPAFIVGAILMDSGTMVLGVLLFCSAFILMFIGILLWCGLKVVKPNEALVLTLFGKYYGTLKRDGFYFVNPFVTAVNPAITASASQDAAAAKGIQKSGSVSKKISLKETTLNNGKQKINDQLGNPIEIGIVVIWKVINTAKAVFNVDNYMEFLSIQADSALRNIVRMYPYDVAESGDECSLRGSSQEVAEKLKTEIGKKVEIAGLQIVEARITHLAYAPEIAAAMLQRQQASAIIDARKMIVDGAVGMVEMALDKLSSNNIVELDDERKAAMVSNLLVVLCGNKDAQPVVNSGSIY